MKNGFTLTEILIVLVIAGILLALILPNSVKAISKAKASEASANVQSCKAALLVCYTDNNKSWTNCTDTTMLKTGGYTDSVIPDVSISLDAATGNYGCN